MFTSKIRHSVVGVGLLAVACLVAASASGFTRGTHQALPAVSGDLGEVVVTAPHDLGEVVVTAPHDLKEVVVYVQREPFDAPFLADVVVTAPRDAAMAGIEGAAMLAVVR